MDEAAEETWDDGPAELLLETNIDDMNPEFYEPLIELLFGAGALDVYLTPIIMKRGRPATKVSVICAADLRAEIDRILIEHSSTLGVRALPIDRTKAGRRIESVVTRWGDVRIKLKIWHGRVLDATPEYADCLAITRDTGCQSASSTAKPPASPSLCRPPHGAGGLTQRSVGYKYFSKRFTIPPPTTRLPRRSAGSARRAAACAR